MSQIFPSISQSCPSSQSVSLYHFIQPNFSINSHDFPIHIQVSHQFSSKNLIQPSFSQQKIHQFPQQKSCQTIFSPKNPQNANHFAGFTQHFPIVSSPRSEAQHGHDALRLHTFHEAPGQAGSEVRILR